MTIKDHIEDIRHSIRTGKFSNEASVSQGIMLRLLRALGWPTYDTQVVIPEYSIEGRRVDFALCHPKLKPLAFIEVKQVGQSDGAEKQLFEYAFHKGVPIAILTDGQEWHFFLPGGQGDYRERRVYKLNLIEREVDESVSRLERYLNYHSVRNGESIKAIEDDYRNVSKQRQIKESLPEAWAKLVEEADELLLEVVSDKVESLCGYKPTYDQVIDFLKKLNRSKLESRGIPIRFVQEDSKTRPTVQTLQGKEGEHKPRGRKGYEQVKNYLIPVIQLMRNGKRHKDAFHSVAKELDVEYSTVASQCTRTLGIKLEEFIKNVRNDQIIRLMKNKYPEKIEVINRELGKYQ